LLRVGGVSGAVALFGVQAWGLLDCRDYFFLIAVFETYYALVFVLVLVVMEGDHLSSGVEELDSVVT